MCIGCCVLCVDKVKAMSWSDKQVVGRWHRLHRGILLSQKSIRNELLSDNEWINLKETIIVYRQRLYDISWLMASLSEPIDRQANKEEGCTARFYSLPSLAPAETVQIFSRKICGQGVLNLKPTFTTRRDDAAVLSCMAYVDLNPIRAKMAKKPKLQLTPAFKNASRPYNTINANLISYCPLSATPDKSCLKALPFLYKITVNW
jgi:hypothetical protein